MELNALTVMTDDSPAPPAPEPRPVSVLHNRALTSLPAAVALPVPADTWSSSREMTCELWIKPEGDSSSGRILSLGNISLSLNRGKLQLSFPGQEGETVLEASGDAFAAGSWHHVAVSWILKTPACMWTGLRRVLFRRSFPRRRGKSLERRGAGKREFRGCQG